MDSLVNSADNLGELRRRVSSQVGTALHRAAAQGFLGSMPISEQIDHALGFVFAAEYALKRHPTSVVDLGTGGGIPGLVLLSCWPDCRAMLLDATERRTEFLAKETAHWNRTGAIEVVRGRAEEIARDASFRQRFDLVASRSFGVPAVTAECGAPLLALGGLLVVSEPPSQHGPARWPDDGLADLGLRRSIEVRFENRFGYQVLLKSAPTNDRYPRRVGIPVKRPLF